MFRILGGDTGAGGEIDWWGKVRMLRMLRML
jgi:hypothetical protein